MTTLLAALKAVMAPARYAFWLPTGPNAAPRILMYHSVTDEKPQDGLNIHPAHFDRQLADLKVRGYRFLKAHELADRVMQGISDFSKIALITFDDGYDNNYHQAFPILKKYGVCATIYLSPLYKDIRFLDTAQIREMAASGFVEFGAHTVNHVNLTTVNDNEAQEEITRSRSMAEELSGMPCLSFAYPYGRFAPMHETMVRNAGFTSAMSTKKRLRLMSPDGLFHLPRQSVDGTMDALQWNIMLKKGRYRV